MCPQLAFFGGSIKVLEFYMVNLASLMCSLCLDSLGKLSQLSAGVCNFQHQIKKEVVATPPEALLVINKLVQAAEKDDSAT